MRQNLMSIWDLRVTPPHLFNNTPQAFLIETLAQYRVNVKLAAAHTHDKDGHHHAIAENDTKK